MYAETITRKKFVKLSVQKQHALLGSMAFKAMDGGDYHRFSERYHLLHSWTEIDRYRPPSWLTKLEALYETYLFHDSYTPHILEGENEEASDRRPAERISWEPEYDVTVVLDQVRSPYNVGSILRIIDNFGLKGLVHSTSGLRLDHPKLKKAARGCEAWVPVRFEPDLITWLGQLTVPIIGIEKTAGALPVSEWVPKESCVLILGNEAYGIAESVRERCRTIVRIPTLGYKNSMNVHIALAVVANRIGDARRLSFS